MSEALKELAKKKLEEATRYDFGKSNECSEKFGCQAEMYEQFNGDYIKYDDALNIVEAALSRSAGPTDEPGFDEATETRWQKAIYEVCKEAVGPKHYSEIDGGGCDSGDALDFTLTEIRQALDFVRENSCSAPDRGATESGIDFSTMSRAEILEHAATMYEALAEDCGSSSHRDAAKALAVLSESPSESAPITAVTIGNPDLTGKVTTYGNESAPSPEGGDRRAAQLFSLLKEICHNAYACAYHQSTFPGACGKCANCLADKVLGENWEKAESVAKLPAPEGMGRDDNRANYGGEAPTLENGGLGEGINEPFFATDEDYQKAINVLYEEWRKRPSWEATTDFEEWKIREVMLRRAHPTSESGPDATENDPDDYHGTGNTPDAVEGDF